MGVPPKPPTDPADGLSCAQAWVDKFTVRSRLTFKKVDFLRFEILKSIFHRKKVSISNRSSDFLRICGQPAQWGAVSGRKYLGLELPVGHACTIWGHACTMSGESWALRGCRVGSLVILVRAKKVDFYTRLLRR